jgi:DNA-nicking Smr family endonuclease
MVASAREDDRAWNGAPQRIPIEDALDLHAFAPRDIPEVVRDYLDEAAARGFREVRLIHGKGIGFQRERVRRLLETHPSVEAFHDAPAERGHWGATIVRLRPRRDPGSPGQDPPSTGSSPLC